MSSFFERNKKKGFLAALLLLLRRGKGVIALLALVAILAGVFVLPGGTKIPWAKRGAEQVGLPTLAGNRFSDMSAALRSARESTTMTDNMGAEKRRLEAKSAGNGDSSSSAFLDLSALPKYAKFSSASGGSASSISGIVHPDEVNRRDRALKMDKGEFLGGLVKSAEAGVIAGGGPMAENSGMADGGKMADAGKMAELTKGSAVNQGEAAVDQALNFQKVPDVPGGDVKLPKGEKYDKLDAKTAADLAMKSYNTKDDGNDAPPPQPEMGKPTFYKLAEARAYSVSAAPPTCLEPGCPKEYAHTTAAIVFDGQNSKVSRIMASSELNENTSPQVPDKTQIKNIEDESIAYYDQTQQCEAYEAWANGVAPSGPPDLVQKYNDIAAANGGFVGQVAKNAGVAAGGVDQDEVVKSGSANERKLMQEMQFLSCAMSCSQDKGTAVRAQEAERTACDNWRSRAAFASALPEAVACTWESCDQGSCDKNKAQLCKSIGNRMRAVCNALQAIWTVKHKCPLAGSGTADVHDCNQ